MSAQPLVLWIDDPMSLGELPERLRLDGYDPYVAQAQRQFVWALAARCPRAVVLGDLPTLARTLALVRQLRAGDIDAEVAVDTDVPVIVLSDSASELCELRALEAGADDFQPASVSYLVLSTRLRAVIRRSELIQRGDRARIGLLLIDTPARAASYGGRRLELSKMEFALLRELARQPGRLVGRHELLQTVWGFPADTDVRTRTVEAHVTRLRRKLTDAGADELIESRRGHGYRLLPHDLDSQPSR